MKHKDFRDLKSRQVLFRAYIQFILIDKDPCAICLWRLSCLSLRTLVQPRTQAAQFHYFSMATVKMQENSW